MAVRLSDAELGDRLNRRRGEAVFVPLETARGAEFNQCHDNAEACVRENTTCWIVRGWLVEDFEGFTYFNAHSVVQRSDGTWFDPTPRRRECPFLSHDGDDEDFALQRLNRPRVQHPLPTFELGDFGVPPEDEYPL